MATDGKGEPPGLASQTATASEDQPRATEAQRPPGASTTYQLEGEVGRGGIGVVIRARDTRLDRPVALKLLRADDARTRARFEREMRITARLQHPAIVPVHEAGQLPSGAPFYAMKLIEGRSLKEAIAAEPTLEGRLRLLPRVLTVAEAIAYAHSMGVIHRDLKPSNIIAGDFGETVVIDWGLAKAVGDADEAAPAGPYRSDLDDNLTVAGQVVGTPAYMPPEQARGEPVDERCDVYSLGAVLRHLVTGKPPYQGDSAQRVLQQVLDAPPAPMDRTVPRDLGAIIDKAMWRDSSRRYADASELANDLRAFIEGRLVSAYDYGVLERARKWISNNKLAASTIAAASVVIPLVVAASISRVVAERDQAMESRESADKARAESNQRNNQLILERAQREAQTRNPVTALRALSEYPLDGNDWPTARAIVRSSLRQGPVRLQDGAGMRMDLMIFDEHGRNLGVASAERLVVWDTASGIRLIDANVLPPSTTRITDMGVRNRGTAQEWLLSASDGTLFVFGINDKHEISKTQLTPCGTDVPVTDLAVSSQSDTTIVSCESGDVIGIVPQGISKHLTRHAKSSTNVVLSRNGTIAYSASTDGEVRATELEATTSRPTTITRINEPITALWLDDECAVLVLGGGKGNIYLHSLNSSKTSRISASVDSAIARVEITHDCSTIAARDLSQHVFVASINDRSATPQQGLDIAVASGPRSIAIGHPDGRDEYIDLSTQWTEDWYGGTERQLIEVGSNGLVAIFSAEQGLKIAGPYPSAKVVELPSKVAVTVATDSNVVVASTESGDVIELDPLASSTTTRLHVHDSIALIRPGRDGRYFTADMNGGCVYLWSSDYYPYLLGCRQTNARQLVTSFDGGTAYILYADGTVIGYSGDRVPTLHQTFIPISAAGPPKRIETSAAGTRITVVSGTDKRSEVFTLDRDLTLLGSFQVDHGVIAAFAFGDSYVLVTRSGRILLRSTHDGALKDAATCTSTMYSRMWFDESTPRLIVPCFDGAVVTWPTDDEINQGLSQTGFIGDVDGIEGGRLFVAVSTSGNASLVDRADAVEYVIAGTPPLSTVEVVAGSNCVVASTADRPLLAYWCMRPSDGFPTDAGRLHSWLRSFSLNSQQGFVQ